MGVKQARGYAQQLREGPRGEQCWRKQSNERVLANSPQCKWKSAAQKRGKHQHRRMYSRAHRQIKCERKQQRGGEQKLEFHDLRRVAVLHAFAWIFSDGKHTPESEFVLLLQIARHC